MTRSHNFLILFCLFSPLILIYHTKQTKNNLLDKQMQKMHYEKNLL